MADCRRSPVVSSHSAFSRLFSDASGWPDLIASTSSRVRHSLTLPPPHPSFPQGRQAWTLVTISLATLHGHANLTTVWTPAGGGVYRVVGYVDWSGNLDTAIAIRTMFVRPDGDVASLQAGAGIVADSVPDDEDLECRNKAAALLAAVPAARRMTAKRSR